MPDKRDDKSTDEELPKNEQTLIRGQDTDASEANNDATVLRGGDKEATATDASEPNDDATVLRSSQSHHSENAPSATEPNDDATILKASDNSSTPSNDETLLRAGEDDGSSELSDETVIRSEEKRVDAPKGLEPRQSDEVKAKSPVESGVSDNSATILRSPKSAAQGGSATILRAPGAGSATILREPSEDGATILRGAGRGNADQGNVVGDDADAATILRAGDSAEDDDRTVMNENFDDDATVLGANGGDQDTTYIASVGKQIQPQGNSEAGRLLKNRFVLEEKIGSGGMGDVYKALDLRQQEAQERDPYIAIKLLNENFSRHKDAFLSLQRETSRTRGIPHPNIMGVYDFDREGDTVFMSMELLDGKPLDDFLKEHPEGVSIEDAWNIIDGISKGLMRAHDAGIVHSDFKPGNIFYTKEKVAKVFDFGIARAVSNPGELEADGEKTVFDAGSLGALTPTYASYEMLKGLEPSKSDDVYALALVAYELFMGKHPYDRVPADKAFDRGLKPKPIPSLKRRHWKALKKALELKGEDRTQSVDEFYEGVFSIDPPYFKYAATAVALIASVGFGAYQTLNVKEKPDELVQYENVIAGAKVTLKTIDKPSWEQPLWHERMTTALNRLKKSNQDIQDNEEWVEQWEIGPDPDIERYTNLISLAYLNKIQSLREDALTYANGKVEGDGIEKAIELLVEAEDYMNYVQVSYRHADPDRSKTELERLNRQLKNRKDRLASINVKEADDEAARLAEENRLELERKRIAFENARQFTYEGYLGDLDEILRCKGDLSNEDIGQFGQLLTNMKSEWLEAFQFHYPKIVTYTATCIEQRIGYVNPSRAREVKAMMMSHMPGETQISALAIEDKDPCDERKLIGRGNRSRSWCVDAFHGGEGPELVVIPPINSVTDNKFAISRAEIKIGEYNVYCQSESCPQLSGGLSLPATNLTIDQARSYANWLAKQTGEFYRLPTVREWDHAASVGNKELNVDENINCTVDSRGVRLGETLLNAVSGRANTYGLYNFVGNAREWAVDEDESLVALGGAHTDPRQECNLRKRVVHKGNADPVTGFRLVREIKIKDKDEPKSDLASSG